MRRPASPLRLTKMSGAGNDFIVLDGDEAARLAGEMAKHGGLISRSDLANYRAIERTPPQGTYKGYTVITAPPSSSGGIALLEMLGILDGTGYEKGGLGSASVIHYQAEAMRRAGWTLPFDVRVLTARLTERVTPAGPAALDCCAA